MTVLDSRLLEQLLELVGGDKVSFHELIETFIEEGAEIVSSMKASLADQDLDVLRRGAHSLKSSAQDFGAINLSTLNAALESKCKNDWPDSAQSEIEEISNVFNEVREELTLYISNNK